MAKRTIEEKINGTKDILDMAKNSGWILDDKSKIPGACKIGAVWLPIPPSQITVSEVNENEVIQTIRTPGNPKHKTGRQEIRIELEIFFPSLYDVNTRFRPLLAQFLRAPFLPIENEDVRDIILPHVMWTLPEEEDRKQPLNPPPFNQKVLSRTVSKDMTEGYWSKLSTDFKERVEKGFIEQKDKCKKIIDESIQERDEILKEIDKIRKEELGSIESKIKRIKEKIRLKEKEIRTIRWEIGPSPRITMPSEEEITAANKKIAKIRSEIDIIDKNLKEKQRELENINNIVEPKIKGLVNRKNELDKSIYNAVENSKNLRRTDIAAKVMETMQTPIDIFHDEQLAIALRNITISTVPGYPEALQCNLTLSVFNFFPYSNDFSFLKTIEDAIKQIEYFSSKSNLLYSDKFRKLFGKEVIYKKPDIRSTTKNLTESKPFLAYIGSLLNEDGYFTGEIDNIKMQPDPAFSVGGQSINPISIGKRQFCFPSPENWLRPVINPLDFKKFAFEYEVSELSIEERENLDILSKQTDALVLSDMQKLFMGLGMDKDILEGVISGIGDLWHLLRKIMSLEALQQKIRGFGGTMKSIEERWFPFPFTLEDAKGTKIFIKNEEYRLEDIMKKLEGLKAPGYDMGTILKRFRQQFEIENIKTYGWDTLYKFAFGDDDDTVITGISATYSTKLATVPLLSYSLPTFQYMGRDDWHTQITFQTCNKALLRILRSLSIKASESKILTQHHKVGEKDWWLNRLSGLYFYPDNTDKTGYANGLFKLIGFNHALFEDFVYESMRDKPGWWNVTVRLVQSDIDAYLYESLLPVGFYRKNVVESMKEWLCTHYLGKHNKNFSSFADIKTGFPYIAKFIFSQMRNYIWRMTYDIFYGGDIVNVPPIPDEAIFEEEPYKNEYLINDAQVERIIKSKFNKEIFKKEMLKIFVSYLFSPENMERCKKEGKLKEKKELLKTLGRTFLPGPLKFVSTILTLIPSRSKLLPYDGIELSGGKILTWTKFNKRLESKYSILKIKDIDIGRLQWGLVGFYLQTLAIRCLSYAPEEAHGVLKNVYKDEKKKIKYTKKDLLPIHDPIMGISGDNYDLYSSYFDLHLPSYQGGNLSTPADFFYKKFEDTLNFDFVQQRIKNLRDVYMNAWKFQFVGSIELYNRIGDKKYFPLVGEELKILKDEYENANKKLREFEMMFMEVPSYHKQKLIEQTRKVKELKAKYDYQTKLGEKWSNKDTEEKMKQILEFASEVDNFRQQYAKEIRELTAEKKEQLFKAERSLYDMKNIIGLTSLMKLGEVQKRVEEENKKIKKDKNYGSDILYSESLLKMNDLIAQVEMFSRMPVNNLYGVVTPWSLDKTEEIVSKVKDLYGVSNIKNKTKQMERAFPALKLYFIEEDANEWGAVDDYYMYNAIESIEVIKSKNSASSLANIVVSNTSGNLTDHRFPREAPENEGTLEEQIVLSMHLREGTTIMIKAGFDNNPNDLDVIFYGKVVSSTLGQRITVTAQGFGAELLEPVNKGIVKKLGANSPARTHGDVIIWAMNTLSGLQHFGSISVLERLGLINRHGTTPFYAAQKWREWDYLRRIHPIFDFYFKFAVYDPRIENIYLPYSKLCMGQWTKIVADFFISSRKKQPLKTASFRWATVSAVALSLLGLIKIVGMAAGTTALLCPFTAIPMAAVLLVTVIAGFVLSIYFYILYVALNSEDMGNVFWTTTFDWVIRNQNMWQVLKEISLYWENYIVTILPYNEMINNKYRETLYLGPRDGVYKYTDAFDSKENMERIQKDIKEKKGLYGKHFTTKQCKKIREQYKKNKKRYEELYEKKLSTTGLDFSETREYANVESQNKSLKASMNYIDRFYDESTGEFIRTTREKELMITKEMEETKATMAPLKLPKKIKGTGPSYFEDGNVMLAIDNPYDLTEKKDKYNEETGEMEEIRVAKYSGYKDIVNYYHVDSFSHIIRNDIRASAEELSNHVIIKYPSDPSTSQAHKFRTREFWADDNIKGGHIRTYVSEQNNIDPLSAPILADETERYMDLGKLFHSKRLFGNLPRVYQVGYNVLANQMRPMYRGELTVIGMPYLRPYDIVFINDFQNNMYGPIEVETVKHRFSVEGFTTEITPHAVISYMNPGRVMQLNIMQGLRLPGIFGTLGDIITPSLWQGFAGAGIGGTVLYGSGVTVGALATLGAWAVHPYVGVGMGVFSAVLLTKIIFSIWDWGFGMMMGRDIINLCGLWKGTNPLVAGMEGAYKDNIRVHIMDRIRSLFDFENALEA